MALSEYQRGICQLIAANRRASGESYVAGGVALNTLLNTLRLSRDIDLFHDTDTALITSWLADRQLLQTAGYAVTVLRETAAFVEAVVSRHDESVLMQWARDSAFRFFPLVEDDLLGLVLRIYPAFGVPRVGGVRQGPRLQSYLLDRRGAAQQSV